MLNFSSVKKLFAFKKWPSKSQWRQFFKILNKKERKIFLAFSAIFLVSTTSFVVSFYINHTESMPATGGVFVQGAAIQPRFINPVYASNDVDRDLVELLFSGLMNYDENGQIISDLADNVTIEEEGKVYKVHLKENILWSDGNSNSEPHKITADDVVFTIQTIQNPDYKSPQRVNWVGVEVEKLSDYDVSFRLKNPYSGFLEYLTVKILPKHIWQNISVEQSPFSFYNLKPVGSGPYKFEKLSQDGSGYINSLSLKINPLYWGEKPHLTEIRFRFFENETGLVNFAKKGEIDGFSLSAASTKNIVKNSFQNFSFSMPNYFAVFFNPEKSKPLAEMKVRQALNYGTNKQEIIEKVFNSQATIVDSPILPDLFGFDLPEEIYSFDLEKAKQLLEEAGYKETESGIREKIVEKEPAFQFKSILQTGSTGTEVEELQKCLAKFPDIYPAGVVSGTFGSQTKAALIKFQEKYKSEILTPSGYTAGTGSTGPATRKKLNELCAQPTEEIIPLSITITTVDQPDLIAVVNLLKTQWQAVGAEVKIKTDDVSSLERDVIKPRNYDALLFGEVLSKIPDPFPFWDSIQIKDPGLNLAIYQDKEADKLLEQARQTLDDNERKEKLEKFQDILIGDAPCVFLYSPDFVYFVSGKIRGISEKMITDPSKIFTEIENWYIKNKRVWK
ncbi:MAG: ABC transporter substrate-binding protein [Patescibacteria group bacterium]